MIKMTEIDERKEIRRCVETGKMIFGLKQVEKNILKGNGKLIIISDSIKEREREKIKHIASLSEIPFYEFHGSALELGSVCGKPFNISAILVMDKGKSNIMKLATKTK